MKQIDSADQSAIAILERLKTDLTVSGVWDIAQAPDGHSFAFHGACILFDAVLYLQSGKIRQTDIYQPLYTRE